MTFERKVPLVGGAGLVAPEPGWTESYDVIVVGSGIAGLSLALKLRRAGHNVLVVTKGEVTAGSTTWAQGGIAAAFADEDSPAQHQSDTLAAGAGLCDEAAVSELVREGEAAVRDLESLGANFDTDESGGLSLTREGGHLRDRIAHAGGDATGAEIIRALVAAVQADPGIQVYERALAIDLIKDEVGWAQGITLHVMGQGQRDGVGAALAPAVILATGGFGQVYSATTNPSVATGDGLALALRAGAVVADVEFVQFHPTVMWCGLDARGQQPLISEAVRGEGARLLTPDLAPLMANHPLGDLAPRDVVAKQITASMMATGSDFVWLDGTKLGADTWRNRFPTILRRTRELGVDPVVDYIPVVPAQHYASGGVRTDLAGRTSIPGLYACGEVAATGVHGANRLASNSLLEGLVFAKLIADDLCQGLPALRPPILPETTGALVSHHNRLRLQVAMTEGAGVIRTAAGLDTTAGRLQKMVWRRDGSPRTEDWETSNLATVALVLAHHALWREETRGSHWREDFPELDPNWRVHIETQLVGDTLISQTQALQPPVWQAWQL